MRDAMTKRSLLSRARAIALAGAAVAVTGCDRRHPPPAPPPPEQAAERWVVAPAVPAPPGLPPALVEQGRRLFLPCAVCHGAQGEGTALAPPLRQNAWRRVDGSLAAIERAIASGFPDPQEYPVPMPPDGGGAFTPQERRALAAYVVALARARTPPDSAADAHSLRNSSTSAR
jgi:mono/diheme cytochrome c family protein